MAKKVPWKARQEVLHLFLDGEGDTRRPLDAAPKPQFAGMALAPVQSEGKVGCWMFAILAATRTTCEE